MAQKRKRGGGGVDSPSDELANSRGDTLGSSADFAKPIYLVVEQQVTDEDERPPAAYSVLKVDAAPAVSAAAAAAAGDEPEPPRARAVADLDGAQHGMSFVAAHSEHGSWIVGFGGHHDTAGGTIIFDPSTLKTFEGPCTVWPKREPVLISHGAEVFVISRRPQVVPYVDFEPWFQSLSFKDGVPSIDCGNLGKWSFLKAPPFFPCELDPYEFADPPEVVVTSYAVVGGSHILLCPQPELKVGTYGYHVVENTWEKVCDENLPFAGQAVLIAGNGGSDSLFAACPIFNRNNHLTAAASLFHMSLATQEAGGTRVDFSFPRVAARHILAVEMYFAPRFVQIGHCT